MDIQTRFQHATAVAEHYDSFAEFAADGMAFLGFPLTDMQEDIAIYMERGPRLRMVMAQRGEAKSTLAALYAVWRLIHNLRERVLVVSAGADQASEVAILIIRVIMNWDILEYMRPDKQHGDRTSVESFDVHYALKGLDKSPSVACVGITSNLPGKRADLLIPDDIESPKNGYTVTMRQQLLQLSKEFTSINTHGDILYLGTPQSKDSIYNTLPGRGFDIKIWPGRFPTPEEQAKYGNRLAPFLSERIAADPSLQRGGGLDGTKGKPADPDRYTEEDLIEKELDKGPEDFQLQHMLDTSMSDATRQQLKLSDLLVANYDFERLPEVQVYQADQKYAVQLGAEFPIPLTKMYHPVPVDCAFVKPKEAPMMYIDPAGGGSDELGLGVSCALGPYIHLLDVKGLKGGLNEKNTKTILDTAFKYKLSTIQCESNMGHGLFEINLRSEILKASLDTEKSHEEREFYKNLGVTGEYSTGQKEKRIIDSFVSATQRHKVIVHPQVFLSDVECGLQHSQDKRAQYSFFYQFNNVTTDRNSLNHDDRVEAAAGAVRYWKGVLVQDEDEAAKARILAEGKAFVSDPMGYGAPPAVSRGTKVNIYNRRKR